MMTMDLGENLPVLQEDHHKLILLRFTEKDTTVTTSPVGTSVGEPGHSGADPDLDL